MDNAQGTLGPVECFVTGHDASGTARCARQAVVEASNPIPGAFVRMIWCTDSLPVRNEFGNAFEDMGQRNLRAPPNGGTRFSILDLEPGNELYLHRTRTLDYVMVVEGRIDMVMDDTTLHLKRGDVVVQRGTNHAWVNRSDSAARLCVVMIDAEPLEAPV